MIWKSWAGDYDIFSVLAIAVIADIFISALINEPFVSRAWHIVHKNGFLVSIRKIILSTVRQALNICPANSSIFGIQRSAYNISCTHVEIWMITNCTPVSSIGNLSSSFPISMRELSVMGHSKRSIIILWTKRWILILEICFDRFDTCLICEYSLCICTSKWYS